MTPKPYSADPRTGHARRCECKLCVEWKLRDYERRALEMGEVRLPKEPGAFVPVRAHFRRQANYLNKQPKVRAAVASFLADLRRRARK